MVDVSKLIAVLILITVSVDAKIEVTNINCQLLDKKNVDIKYCYLKALNRTYKYLSVRANIFDLPIRDFQVNFDVRKKSNGYKPFLYNTTIQGCSYLKGKRDPLQNFIGNLFLKFSNINGSCPIMNDVIIDKLDLSHLDNQLTKVLPWPDGEYAMLTTWYAYNKPRARGNVFAKITH